MNVKYYTLSENEAGADLYIYGDITSWPWLNSDVAAYDIVQEIEAVAGGTINVYINSYGGEVKEGLAIFNALKRHSAKVITHDDGFACSAASVVFMAGDERIMSEASLLMIHNAWAFAMGNADELRKEADDLEKISAAAANTYRQAVSISDDDLNALLDAESWISPAEALEWGFATAIVSAKKVAAASMDARKAIFGALMAAKTTNPPPEPIQGLTEESTPTPNEKKYFNWRKK